MLNLQIHSMYPHLTSRQFQTEEAQRNAEFARELDEIRSQERDEAKNQPAERSIVARMRAAMGRA